MLELAPFTDRNRFFELLHDLGLLGEAAEVGVFRADWSALFMANWKGKLLHAVDPWVSGYDAGDPTSHADMAEARKHAEAALSPHWVRGRVAYHVCASPEAAREFATSQLDFVYLDARHREESVRTDLEAWWPKIRPGGILAGHDFLCPGEHAGGWGPYVQRAVLAFAALHQLTVYLVMEEAGKPWSFYLRKPGRAA